MTPSITDNDVFTALRSFLLLILPSGTEVMQAQDNNVPMPVSGFVTMNNVNKKRLATNVHEYRRTVAPDGFRDVLTPTQYTIQLDFYGESSGDWAAVAQMMLRDEYATSNFPDGIKPLYADDPIQMPLIDGEMNYTQRWKLQAVLQYNPTVSMAQQFASQINVHVNDPASPDPVIADSGIRCVEVNYPNP